MSYWLFKEEPGHYCFNDLVNDKTTVWDGVRNNLALKHLREVKQGDLVYFYHTGKEKSIVGVMKVINKGLNRKLKEHGYKSLSEAVGHAHRS